VIAALIVLAGVLSLSLALATLVQMLYLESVRLRTREYPALEFFKDTLEDRIGLDEASGVLAFSLVKHTTLSFMGIVYLVVASAGGALLWRPVLEACVFTMLTMTVAAYAIPQVVYRRSGCRWLLPLVPLLKVMALPARPLGALLQFLQSLAELGGSSGSAEEPVDQAEHIDALIDVGAEEGILEEDDRKLIQSVVAFGDKTVREVMTPRPNIVAFPTDRTLEDLRQLVINEQYSRIPVFDGSIDNITGFVHVRDLFELDQREREGRLVGDLARPISLVPESKPVDELMREMQQNGAHMAVVVDEYGNTAGLVTLEDLVEEILGEIRDEHEPGQDLAPDAHGGYVVSGSFELARLEELVGLRTGGETESTTIGGLLSEWLGRVPKAGESVERQGVRVEVLASNERRVEQVRVSRVSKETHV
jgi:CBS domain containing-hemolysin-like protein